MKIFKIIEKSISEKIKSIKNIDRNNLLPSIDLKSIFLLYI